MTFARHLGFHINSGTDGNGCEIGLGRGRPVLLSKTHKGLAPDANAMM